MKERFSSAKSQLAKLVENKQTNSNQKSLKIPILDVSESRQINNVSVFQQTENHQGIDKSNLETSVSTQLGSNKTHSFDIGIQGKMEKLMARTKNIQQKLITQLQTSPKNKVLNSTTRVKTEKPFKNFQRTERIKEQLLNQPSVKQLPDERKSVQVIDSVWRQILNKPFDFKLIEEDTTLLFSIVNKWKQNSINYQISSKQISSQTQQNEKIQEGLHNLLQNSIKQKSSLNQQLDNVKAQIVKLTNIISKLEADRSFYVNQINDRDNKINTLNAEIQRLKLNNNCMTEIIYKLQQKRAESEMRVQRGVYQHLKEQNNNLKITLAKIVEENKILTRALTQQISFVREAIIEEIKKKMLLKADLLKAEETIEQLRNMSQLDISGFKNTLCRQFRLDKNQVYQQILPQNLNFSIDYTQQSKPIQNNNYVAKLEGMLSQSRMITQNNEKQKQRLEGLVRKEQYQKQHMRRQLNEIKKALFDGETIPQNKPVEAELSCILQKSVQMLYKIKNLKERTSLLDLQNNKRAEQITKLVGQYEILSKRFMTMRLQKNPSGNEQKLIELQNINTQLSKQSECLNKQLKSIEKVVDQKQYKLREQYEQLEKKDEQLKTMLETIDKLMIENKKLQEQKECQIDNPQRVQQNGFDQNDLELQLEANFSDSKRSKSKSPNRSELLELEQSNIKMDRELKRMKSMSNYSQKDCIIQDIPTNNFESNASKSIGHKSEISDVWYNTSGIHELAERIDRQGILSFKIDQLLQKYNIGADISQVLSIFLKKLDKVQNIQELLSNIQNMLTSFKGLVNLQSQQDNSFLKFNLAKMEQIFSKTHVFLKQNKELINTDDNEESEDQQFHQLTLQSIIDN